MKLTPAFVVAVGLAALAARVADASQLGQLAYVSTSGTYASDLMIGGDIDDEDHFLFTARGMAIDDSGHLYVLDAGGFCIKKFDADGKHLATFGREGEGPGEMLQGFALALDAAGQVHVYDINLRRINVFSADGVPVNTIGLPEFGMRWIMGCGFSRAGDFFVSVREPDFADPHAPAKMMVSRLDLDDLVETPVDSVFLNDVHVGMKGNTMTTITAPAHPRFYWAVMPNGNVVVSTSADYQIKLYSSELELVAAVTHEGVRTEFTDADRRDYVDGFEGNETSLELVDKAVDFPKYKPYYTEMFVDPAGNVLFQRYAESPDAETTTFDVFTADLVHAGTVVLPRLKYGAIIAESAIYNVGLFEEESVVVYRYRPVN